MLLSVAAPVAADRDDDGPRSRILPVRGELDDRSAGQLLGDGFVQFYARPADQLEPCLRLGEDGDVLAPLAGATCTADEDSRLLLIPTAVACSNAEPPPFFAEGAAAQRRCARSLNDQDIASVHAGVDGGALVRLDAGRQFRVTTPQVATTSVADNAFGAEPGPTTFVGDGWLAEIKGLSVGEHTLRFEVELTTGDLLSDEMVVVVVAEGD